MDPDFAKWASSVKVTALISRGARALVTVDKGTPVPEVLATLNRVGVHSLPVTDGAADGAVVGVVDVLDVCVAIFEAAQLGHFAPEYKPGDVAAAFIDTKKLQAELNKLTAADIIGKAAVPDLQRLIDKPTELTAPVTKGHVTTEDTLLTAIDKLGTEARHRVPVVNPADGKIVEMVTQSDLCRYFAANLESIPAKLRERAVGSIASYGLHSVGHHASMAEALHTFMVRKTNCVAVHGRAGEFINAISSKEFVGTLADLGNLGLAVDEFLALTKPTPTVVDGDASIESVVKRAAAEKLYRVWVAVDAKPTGAKEMGVVTLRDLLRSFILPLDASALGHAIPT